MRRASKIFGVLFLLFLLLVFWGCSQTTPNNDAAIARDAMVVPDLAVDAPPPLRKLTKKPLFGQMPLNNRVSHPEFTIFDGLSWFPWCEKCNALPVRMFLPSTPLGQPAARLPTLGQEEPFHIIGMVKGMGGPLEVSVWLGRKMVDKKPPDFSDTEAAFVGAFPAKGYGEVLLNADGRTKPRVLDGIHWMRTAVWIKEPPEGWANLIVTDSLGHGLYVSSPIVIPMQTQPKYQQTSLAPQRRIGSSRARALKAWKAVRRQPRRR
jgi:hypothetical protein